MSGCFTEKRRFVRIRHEARMNRFYWLPPLIIQAIFLIPGRWVLKALSRYEVHGFEHIRALEGRTAIFAANHASEVDPVVLAGIFNPWSPHIPLFYAADEARLFKKKKFGWRAYIYTDTFFKMLGAHPVYVWKQNLKMALRHQLDMLSRGRSIAIFPEGKITKNGHLNEGKRGVAFLLHKTKAVVIPIAISGTYGATFQKFFLRKLHVTLTVGKPIAAEDIWGERTHGELTSSDYEYGAHYIMSRINELRAIQKTDSA